MQVCQRGYLFLFLKELNWAGLLAGDLFRRPKANVLITVDGITKGNEKNCSIVDFFLVFLSLVRFLYWITND